MVSAYCPKCRRVVADRIEVRMKTCPAARGKMVTTWSRAAVCPRCGETLFGEEFEGANVVEVAAADRQPKPGKRKRAKGKKTTRKRRR